MGFQYDTYFTDELCIERKNKKIIIPNAETQIEKGDNLMIIAPNKELEPNGFLGRLG